MLLKPKSYQREASKLQSIVGLTFDAVLDLVVHHQKLGSESTFCGGPSGLPKVKQYKLLAFKMSRERQCIALFS